MKAIDEKLLPCPFCGGTASAFRVRGWSVNCDGGVHECDIAPETTEFPTKAEAIAAWNRRSLAPQQVAPVPVVKPDKLAWLIDRTGDPYADTIFGRYSATKNGAAYLDGRWVDSCRSNSTLTSAVEACEDDYASRLSAITPEVGTSEPVADGMGEFKPCIVINEDAGVTEAVFEDVAYVAEPVFPGVHHWIDKHVAMEDGRLVGMTVWKTAPSPAPIDGEAVRARDEALLAGKLMANILFNLQQRGGLPADDLLVIKTTREAWDRAIAALAAAPSARKEKAE